MVQKNRKTGYLWKAAILLCVVCVLLWFFIALGRLGSGQTQEGKQQLETALRRAAVACYATEGIYPPTLDYLTEHYGIQIDRSRYSVFYEIFAENLMPQITVLVKES
jgi:hypothetical protein